MKNHRKLRQILFLFAVSFPPFWAAGPLEAKYVGEDPPSRPPPPGVNPPSTPPLPLLPPPPPGLLYASLPPARTIPPYTGPSACVQGETYVSAGGSMLSLSQGNLRDIVPIGSISSSQGSTANFYITYNSYNADGSRANIDTVMGYGWTHPYNVFLFNQVGSMYRMDSDGHVTTFQLGAGGTFTGADGYFETLVKNPNGTFTLKQKDQTSCDFASIPSTPFMVGGPVYRLTRVTDRNGNTTTMTYTAGNLTSVSDTYGRTLSFTYNPQKKLSSVTDPAGRTTQFTYDSTGRKLTKITDPAGRTVQYTYNILYQPVTKIDKDGRQYTYTYQSNLPISVKDGTGSTILKLTNPNNWATDSNALAMNRKRVYLPSTTTHTDGRGKIWKHEYDSRGYITKVIAPDGATTSYTYDPATLMPLTRTDANGRTTRYEYDSRGNITKVTNALGHVMTYTYEPSFNQMTSMTDAHGRVTTYEYDVRGNLSKETDPVLQTREWIYDSRGNITSEKDKRGSTTTYEYDPFGNRTKKVDALGNATIMTYDSVGNLSTVLDANSHLTRYEYDGLNRPIRTIDPLGGVTENAYNGEGDLVRTTDCNGNSTLYAYDQRRRLTTTTDALGKTTGMVYDGNNNRTSLTDKNGNTTKYEYDAQNRLSKTTDPLNCASTMSYDPVGNVLKRTDANGHSSTYTYDAIDRNTLIRNAIGCEMRFEYDAGGLSGCAPCGSTPGSRLVTKFTDGNGKVIYFKYDALDRLIKAIRKEGDTADVIDPSDAVTDYTYDANNNRTSIELPNGTTTTYEYDALNRRTKETNGGGDVTTYAYDGVGNVIETVMPNGNVSDSDYDAKNRVTKVTDSEGTVATYDYDCVGNIKSVTDGNANTNGYAYDAVNRIIKATDPLGNATTYEYDPIGNRTAVTDREGNKTTYTYDALYRQTKVVDALGNTTSMAYDCVGNLIRYVDPNLHETTYLYDDVNRMTKETYPNPPPRERSFIYDCENVIGTLDQKGQSTNYSYNDLYYLIGRTYTASSPDAFTYDLAGRLLTHEHGGWLVTYSYDGADRVIDAIQSGKLVHYEHDIPGKTRKTTYPGGMLITETLDFRDRTSRIDGPTPPNPIVQYVYDAGDRVMTRSYSNGTGTQYSYDQNDRIFDLAHTAGGSTFIGFQYEYDKEGNKKFERKVHDPANSEAYRYDATYRLINYKVGPLVGSDIPAPVTEVVYDLDAAGNWKTRTENGVTQVRSHNDSNQLFQIDSTSLVYDGNGNLQDDARFIYTYNERNQIELVNRKSDGVLVGQYQYDALGRRVAKLPTPGGSPSETRYFYDGWRTIEEQDAAGNTLATYVYGIDVDDLLKMDRGLQTFFYHLNTLLHVYGLTDGTGALREAYQYEVYGRQTVIGDGNDADPIVNFNANDVRTPGGVSAFENPYLFTSQRLDPESTLYYFKNRYYSPELGRYTSRDPLGYSAGPNLYAYVNDRPTFWNDPDGLKPTKAEGAAALAAAAAKLKDLCKPPCCVEKTKPCGTKYWDPCTPDECKADAQKIVNAIVASWNNNHGKGANGSKDNVGGYLCWDWSKKFKEAADTVASACWTTEEARARKVGTNVIHYWLNLWACKKKIDDCRLMIDDGWFDGSFTHSPPWPPGPNWADVPFRRPPDWGRAYTGEKVEEEKSSSGPGDYVQLILICILITGFFAAREVRRRSSLRNQLG